MRLRHLGSQSVCQRSKELHLCAYYRSLQEALEAEGLQATVRNMSQDMGFISLTIADFDVELSFGPCEYPHAFRMFTCRMASQEAVVIRVLACRDLEMDVSGVLKVLEDAVLCAWGHDEPSNQRKEASHL